MKEKENKYRTKDILRQQHNSIYAVPQSYTNIYLMAFFNILSHRCLKPELWTALIARAHRNFVKPWNIAIFNYFSVLNFVN